MERLILTKSLSAPPQPSVTALVNLESFLALKTDDAQPKIRPQLKCPKISFSQRINSTFEDITANLKRLGQMSILHRRFDLDGLSLAQRER